MKRRLLVGERVMYADGRAPVNCVFAMRIRGQLRMTQLSDALNKMQEKHPLLRAAIRHIHGVPWYVVNRQPLSVPVRMVERQGDECWKEESIIEWSRLFNTVAGPLIRLVWIRSADVSELLLVCPHCICDGTSLVTLVRELLQLLDEPQQLMENDPWFEEVQQLLPAQQQPGKSKQRILWWMSRLAWLVLWVKALRRTAPRGNDYLVHWKLDHGQTSALLQACKEAGTTVHTACTVAFLSAFRQVREQVACNRAICPVDIRRLVPAIAADQLFAFAPIVELSLDVAGEKGFWEQAQEMKTLLQQKIGQLKAGELLLMGEYFHSSVPQMIRYLRSTRGTHDLTLSNMGKLDIPEQYRCFELEAVYSPTVAFPWRNANTLVVTCFKGQMDFVFLSNEVFLPEKDALRIKEAALQQLLQACEPPPVTALPAEIMPPVQAPVAVT